MRITHPPLAQEAEKWMIRIKHSNREMNDYTLLEAFSPCGLSLAVCGKIDTFPEDRRISQNSWVL